MEDLPIQQKLMNPEGGGEGMYDQMKSKFITQRNENILTAIIVLLNDLNTFELEILKNECDKRLKILK